MVIFHSYVKLPEGTRLHQTLWDLNQLGFALCLNHPVKDILVYFLLVLASQIRRHVGQFLLQQSNLSSSVFWSLLPSVYFYSRFPKEVIVVIIII